MAEPADLIASFYIATVWLGIDEHDVGTRTVVRIRASDEEDYRDRVRKTWPKKAIAIGPVSLSKDQS